MKPNEIITFPILGIVRGKDEEGALAKDEAVAVKTKEAFPKLVAKGKGEMARMIIELAKRFDIPIYEDPDLLEALALLDVGSRLPDELYRVISEIILFIYKANKNYQYSTKV